MDVVVTVDGNQATIQFGANSQVISTAGSAIRGGSSVTVTLGAWTDVSGLGPWRPSNEVVTSNGRGPASSVYLRVGEASR